MEFAEHFNRRDRAARAEAAINPDALRNVVTNSPGHHEPAKRQALLYLFQPRYYLPNFKSRHRSALRRPFLEIFPTGLRATWTPTFV
ncbi:hypothetical protein [Mycobacterium asiaticum]|uniref:hypothetical protein n=1 Tax=Mycobacterium asiaticum TaxID=1790 RepID=UPI000A971869|nr:hypothetical protein [Mycobacterium asiaticum]